MSSRRLDVYLLRFVEFANTSAFLYVAWVLGAHDMVGLRLQRSRLENGLNDFVPLLAAAPFLLAFVLLFRKELTLSQWLLIRAIHQALLIVTLTVAAISLVGLPDTAPATICVTACSWRPSRQPVSLFLTHRTFVSGRSGYFVCLWCSCLHLCFY